MKRQYLLTTEIDTTSEAILETLREILPDVSLELVSIDPESQPETDAEREARIAQNLEIAESMWGIWADEPAETLEEMRAKMWGDPNEYPSTKESETKVEKPLKTDINPATNTRKPDTRFRDDIRALKRGEFLRKKTSTKSKSATPKKKDRSPK